MGVSSLALCDNLQGAMNAADFSDGNCFCRHGAAGFITVLYYQQPRKTMLRMAEFGGAKSCAAAPVRPIQFPEAALSAHQRPQQSGVRAAGSGHPIPSMENRYMI